MNRGVCGSDVDVGGMGPIFVCKGHSALAVWQKHPAVACELADASFEECSGDSCPELGVFSLGSEFEEGEQPGFGSCLLSSCEFFDEFVAGSSPSVEVSRYCSNAAAGCLTGRILAGDRLSRVRSLLLALTLPKVPLTVGIRALEWPLLMIAPNHPVLVLILKAAFNTSVPVYLDRHRRATALGPIRATRCATCGSLCGAGCSRANQNHAYLLGPSC